METTTTMTDRLLGLARIRLSENERAIALLNGRFVGILGPGEHRLANRRCALETERHDLNEPRFTSRFARALERERPDLVAEHLTVFAAGEGEVALLFREGALVAVSRGPKERTLYWTAAGPWEVRRVSLGEDLTVPADLRRVIEQAVGDKVLGGAVVRATVEPGQLGVLHVGGAFRGVLEPGVHFFWNLGQPVAVKLVDMRARTHEVSGQEVLTADRVTIRVNLTARFRVVDVVKAATTVKDFAEALHTALQLAFRRALGRRTLDSLLADKVTVDAEAAEGVRREMAEIGLEVGEIALKDVILPGEMRELLNRVVAAEKEAEANVIRRREETAATRAQLNTAKLMAENPVMLRLKELEALQEVAGKVDRLTVHNGTQGLLGDIVRLAD
ncbi:MAG: slipin family protein [Pseudomonadota bacterium]